MTRTALRATASLAAMIAAATPAAAQSILPAADPAASPATPTATAASGDEIVVTGSRIRRDPLAQEQPIVFVDRGDIDRTGLNSINDVLQRLPSSGGGLNGKFNNSGNLGNPPDGGGVGAGAAEVDLRYLGSRRVLVLVDGLRFVNGASASGVPGSTDLNAIPEAMIERVEVLQDGASAIYGSDAIAGVVNIITKKHQKGIVASAQAGSYGDGDGGTQNYQLSWGNGTTGPTQIVIGGNFVKQDGVLAGDRAISAFPQPYSTSCLDGGCSSYPLNGRFDVLGRSLTLARPVTGRPVYPTDFRSFTTADRFNFAPYNFIEIPIKRYGLFGEVRQELGSTVNFSVKAIWNKRKSSNQAAYLPLAIGPDAGNGNLLDLITVSATNPYNPFGVDLVPGVNYQQIKRRVIEGGLRRYDQSVKTIYGVATLDGKFAVGTGEWFWDVNGSYGRNKATQVMHGNINAQRLQQALGPIANCTGSCVPFDFFGTPGAITPAMLNFVQFIQRDSSEQKTWDFTANVSGHLFDLPGGALGLAAGVEYRDLKGRFDPDPIVAAGFGSDIPAQPTRGGYNVKEAYAELNAPILKDVPFFALLEADGAVRYSDYSTSGSTTTFKAGLNWKPVADLRLRGSWAEGFRAPSIGELFGSLSRFDSAIDDPCSLQSVQTRRFSNDATVRTNCAAQGARTGSNTAPTDQLSVITGGNSALKPETSRSIVAGGVYSPGFIPRFSVEANWYQFKVKGAIQAVGAATTLYRCVYQADPLACASVRRSGSGNVVGIQGTLQNIAGITTRGVDVNVAYRTARTSAGTFGLTWNNTILTRYDVITPTATGVDIDHRAGTEQGSPSQAYPRWKSIAILDWNLDGIGGSLTGRYVSRVREVLNGDSPLKSRFYTDAQIRLGAPSFGPNLGFAFGVNNLFNTAAPGCVSCDINNFDPTSYDTPGRYFYARATFKM